jgi:hypothetical protein
MPEKYKKKGSEPRRSGGFLLSIRRVRFLRSKAMKGGFEEK